MNNCGHFFGLTGFIKGISFAISALPSLHWHCWLGSRKGIGPVKNMGDGGGEQCLVRMEWRPAGWSVCLPLLIFPCTIRSRSSLLALAHPGGPGKSRKMVVCAFFGLNTTLIVAISFVPITVCWKFIYWHQRFSFAEVTFTGHLVVTSAKEVTVCFRRCLSVCLSVSNFAQKLPSRFAWNFQERLAMGDWTND